MLDPFAQLFQVVGATHTHYAWFTKTYGCILPTMHCRSHTTANTDATTPNIFGATMLGVVASVCTQPTTKEMVLRFRDE